MLPKKCLVLSLLPIYLVVYISTLVKISPDIYIKELKALTKGK